MKKYPDNIEKLISEEVTTQKEEDRNDEEFQNISEKDYREYAIENLKGNGIIK